MRLGRQATDPWQNSARIADRPHSADTPRTASAGGRSAVDDLKYAVRNARRLRPGVVPVVSLEWQVMDTKYGRKSKPYFKIVDWSIPGAEVAAIAHDSGGINDPTT